MSDEEVGIVANAIGWAFFGEDSEDGAVVEIQPEESDKCIKAAKRALRQLEEYRSAKNETTD